MCSPGARRWRSKECEGLGLRAEPSRPPFAHPSVDNGPGSRATGGRRSISVPLLVGRGARGNGRGWSYKRGFLHHPPDSPPYTRPRFVEPAGLQEPPAQTPASRLARALQWRAVCAIRSPGGIGKKRKKKPQSHCTLECLSRAGSLNLNLYPKIRPDCWVESVSFARLELPLTFPHGGRTGFRVMCEPHSRPCRSHLVTCMLHTQSRGGSL